MENEIILLWLGISFYVLAGSLAIIAVVMSKRFDKTILAFLCLGLLVQGISIGLRWDRLGHGPYLTMFEILLSNIFSLLLIFSLAYWRYRIIRPTAAVVLPIMFIMMGWLLVSDSVAGHLPPTYDTTWLVFHILFGKVFLGAVLIAIGLAGVILLRYLGIGVQKFSGLPDNKKLDELAYRFMALGFIFQSLMLIAGAIWAQDAWGRYWAWDPLETWSFVNWIILAFALHLRVTYKPSPLRGSILIYSVFIIAFLNFYGVPFISEVPHQGAI